VNDVPTQKAPEPVTGKRSIGSRLAGIPTPLIFVFSVGLALALLWFQGSLSDVADAARDADKRLLAVAALIYLVSLALLASRWHLLVKMIHGTSHFMRASEAFLTSVVINYAAPVGLAVPSRAALTKRALGLSAAETGSVALWEVGVDIIILGILSLLWIAVSGSRGLDALNDATSPVLVLAVIVAGLIGLTVGVIGLRKFKPNLWAKLRIEGRAFIRQPLEHPRDAARVVSVTIIYWLLQVVVLWLLLDAVGVDPSFRLTLGLVSVPILIGMVSPVPGGAGVREALMVAMAHIYDVNSTDVLLAALVYRVALFAAIPILYAGVRFILSREHIAPTMTIDELTHPQSQLQGIQPEEPR
jgi:uncharacterized membrane protein YbhN (UPF0104 family)